MNKLKFLDNVSNYEVTLNFEYLKNAVDLYNNNIFEVDIDNIDYIIQKLNQNIMKDYNYNTKLYYYCKKNDKIILHKMPRNFSWIETDKIGGISALYHNEDILVLETLNIKKIYFFLEKEYFNKIDNRSIHFEYIYCENRDSPSLLDMYNVLKNESFEYPILFGCLGGYGRTGTALACYLCFKNKYKEASAIINELRLIRPKSIETEKQIKFIKKFKDYLIKIDAY